MSRWSAVAALVVVLAAAACSGGDAVREESIARQPADAGDVRDDAASDGAADGATSDDELARTRGGGSASAGARVASSGAVSGGGGAGGTSAALSGVDGTGQERLATAAAPGDAIVPDALPDTVPPAPGDRIIKEGTIQIEVAEDGFDAAFASVIDAAARAGGSVLASNTRTLEDGGTSGSVTIRVPVQAFENLLVGIGGIGKVRSRQITAQDVSTEFVDLESRLRHLQAQERFYLELLEKAQVVGDAIAVKQHLDAIQSQMEQVKGRLAYLAERTSYSTLTIELFETGAAAPPLAEPGESTRPTLAAAWEQARDAFVQVIGTMLVVALFLAPLAVPAALAYLLWRARRRPAALEGGGSAG